MGIFSSHMEEKSAYEHDEFTDDDTSENESTWLENEDQSLFDAILENANWDQIADLLSDRDFDRTADECRNRYIEYCMTPSVAEDVMAVPESSNY